MATSPQRAYRAACPNCGAGVEFASAASASAVCSFCRSTLVRDGEALRRIGVSAELFDDHSPLQLGASGSLRGVNFTLVGRLQYGYEGGTWNEWHVLFDNGRSGWLSEDNGAYVVAFDLDLPADVPLAAELRAGAPRQLGGQAWSVASVVRARLIAAQGELPRPPQLQSEQGEQSEFVVADLRNTEGLVGTLDYSNPQAVQWSTGRAVALSELSLQGLREASEKTLSARGVECPSCGATLEVKFSTTQSISCHQCKAVVDISQGVGGDLAHYAQNNAGAGGLEPQIALGTVGELALGGATLPWQVVGYLERCELDVEDNSEDDNEQTFWREYLLYHRSAGFAFLVDAEDGWSWVRPITGVPQVRAAQATWQGVTYAQGETYAAKVTWVQGEFYWRVRRDEQAQVTDFESLSRIGQKKMSREKSGTEVTWSAGESLSSNTVGDAFKLLPELRGAMQRDVSPLSAGSAGGGGSSVRTGLIIFVVLVLLMIMFARCSSDDCESTRAAFGDSSAELQQCLRASGSGSVRTGGGSFGGYSSGGGGGSHK